MDGYIFTDVQCLNSYNILAPNLWKRYFRMLELDEIMCQRESKVFAGILNRLREAKHTSTDLQKLKQRCVEEFMCPRESACAPRLFTEASSLFDDDDAKNAPVTGGTINRKRALNMVPTLIDNKRKHMECQLSAAQRDKILLQESKDEKEFRSKLSKSLKESNALFAESMKVVPWLH